MFALCTVSLTLTLAQAAAPPQPPVWQRWEHALTSTRDRPNQYADVILRVAYTGPGGRKLNAYGFWDGGRTYRIRCAFPCAGTWRWETTCSDAGDAGLHGRSGTVEVLPYQGDHPLYRHGFLEVSPDRRYLTYADGTPFLWMGDTAWAAPLRASQADWEEYVADRVAKRFTAVQIACASAWAGTTDVDGNSPFIGEGLARWNPAYWQGFERKVRHANERGLVVLVVGLMEPVSRYPESGDACRFARSLVARLHGDFVIFSPSFDSVHMPLGDDVGRAIRDATTVHLITQHPGTPSGQPTHVFADAYYDQDYLDFCTIQSGHNGGRRDRCARQAVTWNLQAYRREPHKPVVNLEAMYDAHGENGWTADDARSIAYRSWLSGALGYTYGAGETSRKVPGSHGGVWGWCSDTAAYDYWRTALQWESARQMQHLAEFLARIDWWRLQPAHDLIRSQPAEPVRWRVLARTATGDLAVAYLPDAGGIEMDLSAFPGPMAGRWFDPRHGKDAPLPGVVENRGTRRFDPPGEGDWVLVLSAR